MNRRLPLAAAAAMTALIALSGCGSSSDAAASPPNSAGSPSSSPSTSSASTTQMSSDPMAHMAMISIKSYAYMGAMTVHPGQMVMVVNNDGETHTLTSDQSGLFNVTVGGGRGTAMFNAPTKPGSYPYHCDFHANMHGTLIVK